MMKLIGLILAILYPLIAFAQTATPTTTATPYRSGPEGAVRALYIPLVTVLATAVPTAYAATPSVPNSRPLRSIGGVSTLNCEAFISLDGGGADNYKVPPAATAFAPQINIPLKENGLYHDRPINIRSASACSAGTISIWGGF